MITVVNAIKRSENSGSDQQGYYIQYTIDPDILYLTLTLTSRKSTIVFLYFDLGSKKFLFLAHIISAETLYFLDSVFFTDIETFVLLNI